MTTTATTQFVLRPARAEDAADLVRLAALDSAAPLSGDVLLAESRGRPVAALSMQDGRVVADPFVSSAEAVALLRLRHRQTHSRAAARPRPRFTFARRALAA